MCSSLATYLLNKVSKVILVYSSVPFPGTSEGSFLLFIFSVGSFYVILSPHMPVYFWFCAKHCSRKQVFVEAVQVRSFSKQHSTSARPCGHQKRGPALIPFQGLMSSRPPRWPEPAAAPRRTSNSPRLLEDRLFHPEDLPGPGFQFCPSAYKRLSKELPNAFWGRAASNAGLSSWVSVS